MTKTHSPRKTPEQWQSLVNQQQRSDLSARAFCTEHHIGYASFCQWRKRLTSTETLSVAEPEPSFIDLSALGADSTGQESRWHIVLSLGNGVELRLSQG